MSPALLTRAVGTLALAWVAAWVCVQLRTPIPWMIGPLLAVSAASVVGLPTRSLAPLRNLAQAVIGVALGLYFTPAVAALVGQMVGAVIVSILWALALGWGFAAWLLWRHRAELGGDARSQRATCYFAAAIGGASEMTLLAEREGGRTDLVAAAHSLRLMLVTLSIPFALTWVGAHGVDPSLPGAREVRPLGLLGLAALAGMGALLMRRTGRANPWFLGPLLAVMALTLCGQEWSAMPPPLSNAAQLLIGVSLGVRFAPAFLRLAPRWLVSVALGTLVMIGLCAVFAWGMSQWTGLHWATLTLGTSPGGITEMAVTAKALALGVPVVTVFQVCRLVAVLILAEPLYRRL